MIQGTCWLFGLKFLCFQFVYLSLDKKLASTTTYSSLDLALSILHVNSFFFLLSPTCWNTLSKVYDFVTLVFVRHLRLYNTLGFDWSLMTLTHLTLIGHMTLLQTWFEWLAIYDFVTNLILIGHFWLLLLVLIGNW